MKAPGPDGMLPMFYKKCWDFVGDDVTKFVRVAFAQGEFVRP